MKEKKNLFLIEWAEKMKELLPENRVDIVFKTSIDKEDERELTIQYVYII
jgi:tRNA A37 threonylcarbamoyladenosine biosynthesis protein TsaE